MGLCACSQGASVAELTASTLRPTEPHPPGPQEPSPAWSLCFRARAPSLSVGVPSCPILTPQGLLSPGHRGRGSLLGGRVHLGAWPSAGAQGTGLVVRPTQYYPLLYWPHPVISPLSEPLLPQGLCSCCTLSPECSSPRFSSMAHSLPSGIPFEESPSLAPPGT